MMSSSHVLAFQHPFTMGCYGMTGSGKSYFVKRIISDEQYIYPPPERVYWFYAEDQPLYRDMPDKVEFIEGLPTPELYDTLNPKMRNVIVIDDQMSEALKCSFVSSLFTRGSHHRNISVILIAQNIYCQAKQSRNISLNQKYIVLLSNPRDKSQITRLGTQIFPEYKDYLPDAYKQSMMKRYSHLVIAVSDDVPKELVLRSEIFEPYPVIYIPRKK